jgi:Fe-S oxidoreductase
LAIPLPIFPTRGIIRVNVAETHNTGEADMSVTVNLFLTCLGENFFSDTLKDMVRVLERLGVRCEMPDGQTCCGQPFYNSTFAVT